MIKRIRLMLTCPFCHSKQTRDKLHTRFYACGSTVNRDTGIYTRNCVECNHQLIPDELSGLSICVKCHMVIDKGDKANG